jgi:hypothetical protein
MSTLSLFGLSAPARTPRDIGLTGMAGMIGMTPLGFALLTWYSRLALLEATHKHIHLSEFELLPGFNG